LIDGVGLYTKLWLPILYVVRDTHGRSEGGSYIAQLSSNGIAPGWAMQMGSENERMLESCTKPQSKIISSKGQPQGQG